MSSARAAFASGSLPLTVRGVTVRMRAARASATANSEPTSSTQSPRSARSTAVSSAAATSSPAVTSSTPAVRSAAANTSGSSARSRSGRQVTAESASGSALAAPTWSFVVHGAVHEVEVVVVVLGEGPRERSAGRRVVRAVEHRQRAVSTTSNRPGHVARARPSRDRFVGEEASVPFPRAPAVRRASATAIPAFVAWWSPTSGIR